MQLVVLQVGENGVNQQWQDPLLVAYWSPCQPHFQYLECAVEYSGAAGSVGVLSLMESKAVVSSSNAASGVAVFSAGDTAATCSLRVATGCKSGGCIVGTVEVSAVGSASSSNHLLVRL